MKILLVNSLFPPDIGGGAEVMTAALAHGCRARGEEVVVACTSARAEPVRDVLPDGVVVHRIPLRNQYWHLDGQRHNGLERALWHLRDIDNPAMEAALRDVIATESPDVIALHNLVGFSGSAWRAAAQSGRPAVQVLHDYYHLCPKSQAYREGRNCERPCGICRVYRTGRARRSAGLAGVVGVSRAVLDRHLQAGLFADVPLKRVVYNARRMPAPAERPLRHRARRFGYIGTLIETKGVDRLLAAFQRLRARSGLDIELAVAGSGEAGYVADLRSRYEGPGITFVGRVDAAAFFESVDVNVVPSVWHDPLPGVVFESLQMGVPVIGARRGGIPEMLRDGVDGLLFDPDDASALEDCLERLARGQPDLAALSAQARSGSVRFGDEHRYIDEHLDVLRLALAESEVPAR